MSNLTPTKTLEERLRMSREGVLNTAKQYGAFNVRVFGSVARESSHQGGDINFLVDMEPGCSLLDRIGLKQDLEDLLACRVDIATPKTLHERIRDQVMKEALPL